MPSMRTMLDLVQVAGLLADFSAAFTPARSSVPSAFAWKAARRRSGVEEPRAS